MNEMSAFEARLAATLAAYAAAAPAEVNAATLAATIVRAHQRGSLGGLSTPRRWFVPLLVGLLLLVLAALTAFIGAELLRHRSAPYNERVTPFGAMTTTRIDPVVVALSDGRVLIAGGGDPIGGRMPAEVFDPTSGLSQAVAGDAPVGFGSGVLLADGRVLVITFSSNRTSSLAYLFDPNTMTFAHLRQEGFSNAPPFGVTPSLVTLLDGRVLVSGGKRDVYEIGLSNDVLAFDPASESFTRIGALDVARIGHSMAALGDGRVLIVGGFRANLLAASSEVFDPATGMSTTLLPARSPNFYGGYEAVTLADGTVLAFSINGGPYTWSEYALGSGPARVVRYDAATGEIQESLLGEMVPTNVTLLNDGRILLSGARWVEPRIVRTGNYWDLYETWAQLYDPQTGTAVDVAPPRTKDPGSALLTDGRVLFAGGTAYPPADELGNGTGQGFLVDWLDAFE